MTLLYYGLSAFVLLVGAGFLAVFAWAAWNEATSWWDRRHPGPGPIEVVRRNWLRHLADVRDRQIAEQRGKDQAQRVSREK